ncbi:MAG: 3-oxoacyl-ACP reductase [Anaerolineaceae bacterium]|nr:3-oxoacyl-ACP reductase [Anaerolineaceae bacterium]
MSYPLELTGNVILITGGAQGIGKATAELCAERGAAVVIADFNKDGGETTAAGIRANGGQADFYHLDVRSAEQVEALASFIREKHGKLNKVVCAAGVLLGPHLQPEEFPLEDFEKTLDINVVGPFLCAKYTTSLLEAAGNGVFVVVASGAGVFGGSSSLAYGSSKGGANGLSMTLDRHLASRGIRVNTIYPGNIITDMKLSVDVEAARKEGRPEQEAHDFAAANYGLPPGVAQVIAFVISDEADYLRGGVRTR